MASFKAKIKLGFRRVSARLRAMFNADTHRSDKKRPTDKDVKKPASQTKPEAPAIADPIPTIKVDHVDMVDDATSISSRHKHRHRHPCPVCFCKLHKRKKGDRVCRNENCEHYRRRVGRAEHTCPKCGGHKEHSKLRVCRNCEARENRLEPSDDEGNDGSGYESDFDSGSGSRNSGSSKHSSASDNSKSASSSRGKSSSSGSQSSSSRTTASYNSAGTRKQYKGPRAWTTDDSVWTSEDDVLLIHLRDDDHLGWHVIASALEMKGKDHRELRRKYHKLKSHAEDEDHVVQKKGKGKEKSHRGKGKAASVDSENESDTVDFVLKNVKGQPVLRYKPGEYEGMNAEKVSRHSSLYVPD